MQKTLILTVCAMLAASSANTLAYAGISTQIVQQQQTCRGVVKDANGEMIIGADRKSTRLNSSHANISYAVFCLKKKHITLISLLTSAFYPHTIIFISPSI